MAEDNSILVCRYLCEGLPEQELERMRLRMNGDLALQEELDFYQELKQAVSDEDMMQYRQQIRGVFERKKRHARWYDRDRGGLMVAVGVTLLIAVMTIIWMTSGGPRHRELFRAHYEQYPGMTTIRSGRSQRDVLRHRAFYYYKQKNWSACEAAFEKMIDRGRDGASVHFYLGLVKIELDKDEQALEHFNRTLSARHTLFRDQAYWYSALTLLKSGRREEAKRCLTQIVDQNMWKSEKAREILRTFV